ncbi:SCO family protein [Roseovarius sp. S1116L3]|uniref:SCO family protein n=1 Tax=Roseovarius roseus TaxID=3342636 RepID=UPI003728DA06
MTRIFAIAAGLALIIVLGGIYLITAGRDGGGDFAQCRSTAVADGGASIGGDFTLVDETGATVTSAEVLDQPSLIYFGYTFCPDVCPLDVARNAEATEILEERGIMVKPIFISVDPARDTPEVVADFTDAMHPRMLGLTGSPEQVKAASQAYRTFYKAHEPAEGEEEYYLVDHSTFTYLTLPGRGFVEFFRRETTGEEMADKVQCFVEAS